MFATVLYQTVLRQHRTSVSCSGTLQGLWQCLTTKAADNLRRGRNSSFYLYIWGSVPTIIPERAGSLPNKRSTTAHWIVLYYSSHMTQCLILVHSTHSGLTQQFKIILTSVYTCWILIMWYFIDPCWKSLFFCSCRQTKLQKTDPCWLLDLL